MQIILFELLSILIVVWLMNGRLSQAASLLVQHCSLTYFSGQMAVFLRKMPFLSAKDRVEGIGRHCLSAYLDNLAFG